MKSAFAAMFAVVSFLCLLRTPAEALTPTEYLGKLMFFDPALSNPAGQSCAECHGPEVGWTGPDSATNAGGAVFEGAVPGRFGNRKPPASSYAGFNPVLHRCGDMTCGCEGGGMSGDGMGGGGGMGAGGGMDGGGGMGGGGMMCQSGFAGGLFWDGRATGWVLRDPLTEQALGPFLNPLEMNNPDPASVCLAVAAGPYAAYFEEVWGPGTLDCAADPAAAYEKIGRSIAAYERSPEANPFSSKFDSFWRNREQARAAGRMIPPVQMINMMNMTRFKDLGLNDMELMGLMVFNTKGKCSTCHPLQPMHGSVYPLFTDFQYHNLGVPKNPVNPFYQMPSPWNPAGAAWIDPGLGGFLATTAGRTDSLGNPRDYVSFAEENYGKHKTPTLRNVDKRPAPEFVKAFGHNGFFKSLPEIVHFYNCRDVPSAPQCMMQPPFPPAEEPRNVNTTDVGNLGLTPQEGMALIAFLKTLTDETTAARVDRSFPDFNFDGHVNTEDYNLLLQEIRKPAPRDSSYDLNQDGKVDLLDARFFYTVSRPR